MQKIEKSSKASNQHQYDTDNVAINVYSNLARDFQASEGRDFYASNVEALFTSVTKFRSLPEKELGFISKARFKRTKQMEHVLKKYRFSNDAYTDCELSERTINKFIDDQLRLHKPMDLKLTGYAVVQRARKICRRILGEFPGDDVITNARFGRKSSIGCPLSLAYIDIKLSVKKAFTATRDTAKFFFDQVLPGDHILKRIVKDVVKNVDKERLRFKSLMLVEVPKTWKVYRLITPLTLIGLFFSYGIGRVVQSRLKDAGLDISKLQDIHRALVKSFSVNCRHATADLSAASDSITSELLNRILPRPWYRAVRKTFVRQLNLRDGRSISTCSVLPMGNGATFPVETLIFYCLIKAIGELSHTKGIYSVYGDDLIYPSSIHKYVCNVFPQLHLILNTDKTFVSYPFRESCGSDFYRGCDVRPYMMKGERKLLTRVRYEAHLYQVYNGLVARWDPLEIRDTIKWLLSELAMVSHGILRVPPSFPDSSGLRVKSWNDLPLSYNLLPFSPIVVRFTRGTRWFQFDLLTVTPKKRVVKTTEPYYWLALQGYNDEPEEHGLWHAKYLPPSIHTLPRVLPKGSLSWNKIGYRKPRYYRGRKVVDGRKLFQAVVSARKGDTVSTASTKTGSITYWT
jgi:hypothetical protein